VTGWTFSLEPASAIAADTVYALHEPVLAEVPRLQLERCQFGIQAGEQPIRKALF
jgi:hypothetical protein